MYFNKIVIPQVLILKENWTTSHTQFCLLFHALPSPPPNPGSSMIYFAAKFFSIFEKYKNISKAVIIRKAKLICLETSSSKGF